MGERRFVARSDLGRGCEASYDRGMLSGSPTVMRLSAGRRELSRRYPKHAWPEDPLTARPPPVGKLR